MNLAQGLQDGLHAGAVLRGDHQDLQGLILNQTGRCAIQFTLFISLPVFLPGHDFKNIQQITAAAIGIQVLDGLQQNGID